MVDVSVAQRALVCDFLELGTEPLIDAFRVKHVLANRNLSDRCSLIKFLETDHTLWQLERIQLLIIRLLLDQLNKPVDPLESLFFGFLDIGHPISISISCDLINIILKLLLLKLFLHLPLLNTDTNDGA